VAPVISILNLKNGCPNKAVDMHATTLEKAKYHLKTKQGISTNYYNHSEETPVHGNGQGAGDSPSQWCQQSAMLFDLYEKTQTGNRLSDRTNDMSIEIPITAFADDTNLIGNDDTHELQIEELISKAQDSFTSWNELLHATGHFLELEKCSCYLSIWDFQSDGYAFMIPPNELAKTIKVKDLAGNEMTIKQLSTDQSQKLLGIMRNPIGNQQDEIERLKQKSDRLAHQINIGALSTVQAKMAYDSFFLPAMRYSLPITAINQMDFESIQKNATLATLAALGNNRHMPREVVFCSNKYQGLG
jgi:uncharacterized protein YjbK